MALTSTRSIADLNDSCTPTPYSVLVQNPVGQRGMESKLVGSTLTYLVCSSAWHNLGSKPISACLCQLLLIFCFDLLLFRSNFRMTSCSGACKSRSSLLAMHAGSPLNGRSALPVGLPIARILTGCHRSNLWLGLLILHKTQGSGSDFNDSVDEQL